MNKSIINLNFSHNWNTRTQGKVQTGKLDCACFSTIRLENGYYELGQVCRVIVQEPKKNDNVLGYARIVSKTIFEKAKITDGVAYLDTGYNRNEVLGILNKMYPTSNDKTPFCFLILKYMSAKEIETFASQTAMVLAV
jgi:hypothetical protein